MKNFLNSFKKAKKSTKNTKENNQQFKQNKEFIIPEKSEIKGFKLFFSLCSSQKNSGKISCKKFYFTLIILVLFCAGFFFISGFFGILQFLFSLLFYSLLFYFFHFFWSLIFNIQRQKFIQYLINFSYRISILLTVFFIFFGSIIYYQNQINPARLPEFTLSNGKKTVVFQAMAHIGSPSFYNQISENIKNYKKKDFILFYEGVKPGKKENMQKFDSLLGINFTKNTYSSMSKLYGLEAQKNDKFLNIVNNKDYNVDIGIDDIIAKYETKFGTGYISNKSKSEVINVDKILEESLNSFTKKELQMIIYFNQALMNLIIKDSSIQDSLVGINGKNDLMSVILDDRNKIIADSIIKSENNKIVVLYGLLHFNGVFELLQRNDSNWKLEKVRYFQVIK